MVVLRNIMRKNMGRREMIYFIVGTRYDNPLSLTCLSTTFHVPWQILYCNSINLSLCTIIFMKCTNQILIGSGSARVFNYVQPLHSSVMRLIQNYHLFSYIACHNAAFVNSFVILSTSELCNLLIGKTCLICLSGSKVFFWKFCTSCSVSSFFFFFIFYH